MNEREAAKLKAKEEQESGKNPGMGFRQTPVKKENKWFYKMNNLTQNT